MLNAFFGSWSNSDDVVVTDESDAWKVQARGATWDGGRHRRILGASKRVTSTRGTNPRGTCNGRHPERSRRRSRPSRIGFRRNRVQPALPVAGKVAGEVLALLQTTSANFMCRTPSHVSVPHVCASSSRPRASARIRAPSVRPKRAHIGVLDVAGSVRNAFATKR